MSNIKVSNNDIKSKLADIVRQISITENWKPDVILAPSRGGLIPGVMLSHYFSVPFEGFKWQTRDGKIQDDKTLKHILDHHAGQNVLIIDDINDTGKTLCEIKDCVDHIMKGNVKWLHGEVKYAALYERFNTSFHNIDFVGEVVESEQWFDFPWENWWI